jgi:hypothetical protein
MSGRRVFVRNKTLASGYWRDASLRSQLQCIKGMGHNGIRGETGHREAVTFRSHPSEMRCYDMWSQGVREDHSGERW